MTMQTAKSSGIGSRPRRILEVEVLALDLSTCTRCVGSLENLEKAVDVAGPALAATGVEVSLKRVVVDSEEVALRHRFVSSPTLRINGRDIVLDTLESRCDSCSDLCGCDGGTECRVWGYQGAEYTEAPVGLIVEALFREVVGAELPGGGRPLPFTEVPKNLRQFFAARESQQAGEKTATSCCSGGAALPGKRS